MASPTTFRIVLLLSVALALTAQQGPPEHPVAPEPPDEVRLPNGKLQREEILKADYQKNLEDARALSKLADQLKTDWLQGQMQKARSFDQQDTFVEVR